MNSEQNEYLKKLTPDQKLRVFLDLYSCARKLKEAGLRLQHPDWTKKKILHEVKEIFLYAQT